MRKAMYYVSVIYVYDIEAECNFASSWICVGLTPKLNLLDLLNNKLNAILGCILIINDIINETEVTLWRQTIKGYWASASWNIKYIVACDYNARAAVSEDAEQVAENEQQHDGSNWMLWSACDFTTWHTSPLRHLNNCQDTREAWYCARQGEHRVNKFPHERIHANHRNSLYCQWNRQLSRV